MFTDRLVRPRQVAALVASLALAIPLATATAGSAAATTLDVDASFVEVDYLCGMWGIQTHGTHVQVGCGTGIDDGLARVDLIGPGGYARTLYEGPLIYSKIAAEGIVPGAGAYAFVLYASFTGFGGFETHLKETLPFTVEGVAPAPGSSSAPAPSPNPDPGATAPVSVPAPVLARGPNIVGRTPGASSRLIDRDRSIVVRFDRAVWGVSTRSVRLRDLATGRLVPLTIRHNSTRTSIILDPIPRLSAARRYRVELAGSIHDRDQLPLRATSWTFTTGRT